MTFPFNSFKVPCMGDQEPLKLKIDFVASFWNISLRIWRSTKGSLATHYPKRKRNAGQSFLCREPCAAKIACRRKAERVALRTGYGYRFRNAPGSTAHFFCRINDVNAFTSAETSRFCLYVVSWLQWKRGYGQVASRLSASHRYCRRGTSQTLMQRKSCALLSLISCDSKLKKQHLKSIVRLAGSS